MKKPHWFPTYSKWFATHGNEHKEYEDRKGYPWHILSKYNFDPGENGNQSKRAVVKNKEDKELGAITVIHLFFRKKDSRYQYDISLEDFCNNVHSQYRLVFSENGTLITVHKRGKEVYSSLASAFIQRGKSVIESDELPSKRVLRACFAEIINISLSHLVEEGYGNNVHIRVPWKRGERIGEKRLLLNFSKTNNHWVTSCLYANQANLLATRLDAVKERVTVLYGIETKYFNEPYTGTKNEVINLSEYSEVIMSEKLRERLLDLQEFCYTKT